MSGYGAGEYERGGGGDTTLVRWVGGKPQLVTTQSLLARLTTFSALLVLSLT